MFAAALLFQFADIQVSAWVVPWGNLSLKAFEQRGMHLSEAMFGCITVAADGTIVEVPGDMSIEKANQAKSIAKKHKVLLYAMVNNYWEGIGFEPNRMSKLFDQPSRAVRQLSDYVVKNQYDGLDLDFESLKAEDRDRYSSFVAQLAKELHSKKKKLSVTVHPKFEEPGTWDGTKSQDWVALGKSADVVKIMCYDYSWSTSPAGPIAPTEWVTNLAKYALKVLPKEKIDIGVAWYGYQWKKDGPADSLVFEDVGNRLKQIDLSSGEMWDGALTRFSGKAAFEQKLKAVTALGLTKFSAWYCGSEDPGVWDLIPKRK